MITQRLVLDGGYPDGIWTCAGCSAPLEDGGFAHPDDCPVFAEARAAERRRCTEIARYYECPCGESDCGAMDTALAIAGLMDGERQ